jgi:hypothetical protein
LSVTVYYYYYLKSEISWTSLNLRGKIVCTHTAFTHFPVFSSSSIWFTWFKKHNKEKFLLTHFDLLTSPSSSPTWARNRFPELTTFLSMLGHPLRRATWISHLDRYLQHSKFDFKCTAQEYCNALHPFRALVVECGWVARPTIRLLLYKPKPCPETSYWPTHPSTVIEHLEHPVCFCSEYIFSIR